MTQEKKELLFIDLCDRIPYKTVCASRRFDKSILLGMEDDGATFSNVDCLGRPVYELLDIIEFDVKPYLRPMESMTEEERNEYLSIKMQETERVALSEVYRPEAISEIMDWLNAHHFDYRRLIERGLAIKAPEGMYK